MAQFGRPDSTLDTGSWSAVGSSPLHNCINEVTPNDDSTYALAESDGLIFKVTLSDIADPSSSTGHIIRCTSKSSGSGKGEDVYVYLYQGETLIASSGKWSTRGVYGTDTLTLTAGEAGAITDYTNLRFWVEVDIGSGETMRVTQIEFEVPDAGVPPGWNRLEYTNEPPTPNAWNQVKREAGSGWRKLLYG